ncbi:MAG TPA: hypothetical protein VIP52_02110, partial [Candidatus Dormibacteraeota bacterium]
MSIVRRFAGMIGWRIARVAAIAAAVALVIYGLVVTGVDVSLFRSMITDADSRVIGRINVLLA